MSRKKRSSSLLLDRMKAIPANLYSALLFTVLLASIVVYVPPANLITILLVSVCISAVVVSAVWSVTKPAIRIYVAGLLGVSAFLHLSYMFTLVNAAIVIAIAIIGALYLYLQ